MSNLFYKAPPAKTTDAEPGDIVMIIYPKNTIVSTMRAYFHPNILVTGDPEYHPEDIIYKANASRLVKFGLDAQHADAIMNGTEKLPVYITSS